VRELSIKKLFLAFLLVSVLAIPVSASQEDGFEDGDYTNSPTWTEQSLAGGSASVQQSTVLNGTYSLEFATDGAEDESNVVLDTTFDSANLDDGESFTAWVRKDTTDDFQMRLFIQSQTGFANGNWVELYDNNGDFLAQGSNYASGPAEVCTNCVSADTWYKYEIVWHSNSVDFYVYDAQGNQLGSITGADATDSYSSLDTVLLATTDNTQTSASTFYDYVSYNAQTTATNSAPSLSNPNPSDGDSGVITSTDLSIDYSDPDGDSGTVTFYWQNGTQIQQNMGVSSGATTSTSALNLASGTTYNWYVEASDGNGGTTSAGNYSFTTASSSGYQSPVSEKLFYSNGSCPAYDFSGNSQTGVCNGGISTATGYSDSEGNWDLDDDSSFEAYSFDGTDDYINASSLDITSYENFTLSTWVKLPSGQSERGAIMSWRSGTGSTADGVTLQYQTGEFVGSQDEVTFYYGSGSSNDPVHTDPIADNTWHHVVATVEESGGSYNVSIYSDGSLDDSLTMSSLSDSVTSEVLLGQWTVNGANLQGDIDETRVVLGEAWNQSQIDSIRTTNEYLSTSSTGTVPELSNPSPVNQSTIYSSSETLSIDYSDEDGDSGNVSIYWKNSTLIESFESVSSGETVSTSKLSLDAGSSFEWYATATDGVNETSAGNYSFTTGNEFNYPEYPYKDTESLPLNITPYNNVTNPILTAEDVTDVNAQAVADPFIVPSNDTYHMFFEILLESGSDTPVGHATSSDGVNWNYQGTTFDTNYHISFPLTDRWQGSYYQSFQDGEGGVPLLKASNFPSDWSEVNQLTSNGNDDHFRFRWNEKWWLLNYDNSANELNAFYSDSLESDSWTAHSNNPVVSGRDSAIRPGGRAIVQESGVILPFQDISNIYGEQVNLYNMTTLTTSSYSDSALSSYNPVISPDGSGWNADRMHHFDAVHGSYNSETQDDIWLVAVDGSNDDSNGNTEWSIGLYANDGIEKDFTPPTSSDNWTATDFVDKTEVDVNLTATDDDSGVANISYRVNGGSYTTVTGSSATVTINTEGNNTLEYYATDNAGNQESVNTEYVALNFPSGYITIGENVEIGQDDNNADINVTQAFNVSSLDVYGNKTGFGDVNWSLSGSSGDAINAKLTYFNGTVGLDEYLANYSVSSTAGNTVTSQFEGLSNGNVFQVIKDSSFFNQYEVASSVISYGFDAAGSTFESFNVWRSDGYRPQFTDAEYVLDQPSSVEQFRFGLDDFGEADITSADGLGLQDSLNNSALVYNVSLPIAGEYSVTDSVGLTGVRNIDLGKSDSGVGEDTGFNHDLSTQGRDQELNITNNDDEVVDYSWTSEFGNTFTGSVSGSSTESLSDSVTGDFLNENAQGFSVGTDEVVLGFNYTGVNPLDVENTVSNGFTGVSTSGVFEQVNQCSQKNNSVIDVSGGTTETFNAGFTCDPGSIGNPTQDVVNISQTEERVWYNSTDMVINSNKTSNTDIVIRAEKTNLKNPDNRDGGSLRAIVEGVDSSNSSELNVSDTGSFFRVTVGDIQASTLYTTDSDWSVTYTLSDDATEAPSGGGGGGGAISEDQILYFGSSETEDGLESLSVPFGENVTRSMTVTNERQAETTAQVSVGSGGVCRYVSVQRALDSNQFASTGNYDLPAATQTLGTVQSTESFLIRFNLPEKDSLEEAGVEDFSCEFSTSSSYGTAEPLVVEVDEGFNLDWLIELLKYEFTFELPLDNLASTMTDVEGDTVEFGVAVWQIITVLSMIIGGLWWRREN